MIVVPFLWCLFLVFVYGDECTELGKNKMSEKNISLICDEEQRDLDYVPPSAEKQKNSPKQTTLHTFFSTKKCDSPTYDDQTKLQYLNKDISSPVPVVASFKTPHSTKRKSHRKCKKRQRSKETNPPKTRQVPLPLLDWAESAEVWKNMIQKEEASNLDRNPRLFEKQACYLPRMRAILLDWIMEVCEVYKLRRVTYYLAVDYIDRYLTINPDVPKTQLQLVGVTCLFMAAKLEEIYPPKLSEFSYVCDGACSEIEILTYEIIIVNSLGWDMNPQTPSGWLNLYLQIHTDARKVADQGMHRDINSDFIYPKYSGYEFIRASQIIDLFSLDPGFLRFAYSIIAAAAVYFVHGKNVALNVSGLTWEQLKDCVEYMAVFYKIIRDSDDPKLESIPYFDEQLPSAPNYGTLKANVPQIITNENHSIQTHTVDLNYFEKATLLRLEQMGLRVEKTLIRKKREEEATMVMFDLEKVNIEEFITPQSSPKGVREVVQEEVDETATGNGSAVDIFNLDKKARVTFDDILASLDGQERKAAKPVISSSEDEI